MPSTAQLIFASPPLPADSDIHAWGARLMPTWAACFEALEPGCRAIIHVPEILPLRHPIVLAWESLGADAMGAVLWQRTALERGPGEIRPDFEWVLVFKKPGRAKRPDPSRKEQARMTAAEWTRWFAGHWNLPDPQDGEPFPEELLHRILCMYSFPGDTVLCPWPDRGPVRATLQAHDRTLLELPL
jgi:site-specific DNA-methyltransferase (adenine-specific)